MKLRYIVNPFSGLVRRQKGLADRLRCWIAEQRLDATLVLTDAPGHATDLARQAVKPIDDIRAGADYRRSLAGNLLLRLLPGAIAGEG